ncbi:hypothetical protein [Tsukamurella spumae]|uniref:Alkaline proteinase inhibitor/ Outer membrane lipoprotein Omp19 domain-containing protein n=1 Tax=Tsukamurella spumae TaxID=44753 RepID=A0A846X7U7_9ACTN|nr:hypothetical protein [Tsukamurella spumae]NKY19820.1 hypothetical protein [Tsukamurella spumae]
MSLSRGRTARTTLAAAVVAAAVSASLPAAASAAPVPANLVGNWKGDVTWPTGSHAVTLTITSSRPVRGHINVPGYCAGEWREVDRNAETVRVGFTRTSGIGCGTQNVWRLAFPREQGYIYGVSLTSRNDYIALSKAS